MADRHTPNPDDWQDDDSFESTLTEQPLAAENPTPVFDDAKRGGGSRTTRILLGALLLTVAGFIWYNYVWQPDPAPQVLVGGNGTGINGAMGQSGLAAPAGLPLVAAQDQDGQELPLIASPDAAGTADTPGTTALSGAAESADDGLVAPLPQPGAAARDLEITELPFLIAQPLAQAEEDAVPGEDDPSLTRPAAVRVSVNPFSPVLLPEPVASAELAPAATVPDQAQPQPEPVLEVSIPDGPDQTAITSIAPPAGTTGPEASAPAVAVPAVTPPAVTPPAVTPQAVAPMELPGAEASSPTSTAAVQSGSGIAQSLPRPLPGPSMSPVPAVLQERRAVEDVPQPNLAQVATVAEPVTDVGAAVADRTADTDLGIPEVLPPAASRVMPTDGDPLVAGATPLSRYLRDNDVSFTGMVLGPVSQGVFRSVTDPRPVVVGIGQNLPDTEITLTDLRGQQAEFTLSDASQFLTLDLRR